ncbi:MAG: hypothetical protein ABL921_26740 [Pirellula sp.]
MVIWIEGDEAKDRLQACEQVDSSRSDIQLCLWATPYERAQFCSHVAETVKVFDAMPKRLTRSATAELRTII